MPHKNFWKGGVFMKSRTIKQAVACAVLMSLISSSAVSASTDSVGLAAETGSVGTVQAKDIAEAIEGGEAARTGAGDMTVGDAIVSSMTAQSTGAVNGSGVQKNSLSKSLSENFGLEMNMNQYFDEKELSNMGIGFDVDFGILNDMYFASQTQIFNSLEESMQSMGQAANVMDVFNSNFGDMQLSLEQPSIPANFQPSAMLSTMNSAIQKQYADVTGSGMFANVKGSIGIGNVFSIAKAGLSSDLSSNLMPTSGMLSIMGDASSAAGSAIKSEFGSLESANKATGEALKANVLSSTYNTAMSSLDWSNSMVSPNGVNSGNMASRASELSLWSVGKYNSNHGQSLSEYNSAYQKNKSYVDKYRMDNPLPNTSGVLTPEADPEKRQFQEDARQAIAGA